MHWTLTRKDNNERLELPARLRWTDEHDWQAIAQATPQYSLGGAVIVQQGTKLAGRPVTLGNEDQHNWLRKATITTLLAWADVPERNLSHPRWRATSQPRALDARRRRRCVVPRRNPLNDDLNEP